jgi:hypothetical protein
MNDVSRGEMDARIVLAITELRVELANISGKIDSLSAHIDGRIDIAVTKLDECAAETRCKIGKLEHFAPWMLMLAGAGATAAPMAVTTTLVKVFG